jgi:hypothetical protein
MQCNVQFGNELSICPRTEGNHGKPWSIWPVAGLPDANWILASRPAVNTRTLTLFPIRLLLYAKKFTYLSYRVCYMCNGQSYFIKVKIRVTLRFGFTANQLVLASSPFRLTTRHLFFLFQLNLCGHSPYVTSSLTRKWVFLLWIAIWYVIVNDNWKLSPYLTGNTLRLRYKAQPVNAV